MKDTLLDVKDRLFTQLSDMEENDIHILTDDDIPTSSRFPCIGLKDGDEEWTLVGGTMADGAEFDKGLVVKVIAFVQMFRDDGEGVVGDGADKGILELALDIITALNGHDLGDSYTAPLVVRRSGESRAYVSRNEEDGGDEVYIQMKEITFTCSKQVTI